MQIVDREAHEILAALRSREVTCEALMAATLQRIMAVNGNVNAIVSLREEQELLQQARQADSEPARGVLHGMPIAVKDLARVAGLPFSGGSPITAGTIPDQDDAMVAHLRAAGAIFEFIYGLLHIEKEPRMTRFVADELAIHHWFDIGAAKRDLNYHPRISTTEGLEELTKWLQD